MTNHLPTPQPDSPGPSAEDLEKARKKRQEDDTKPVKTPLPPKKSGMFEKTEKPE